MKSYHLHQKQARNKTQNSKSRNRNQTRNQSKNQNRNQKNGQRNRKNANQKVAPTEKLKHLKTKQQKAANTNTTVPDNKKQDEIANINATLSVKEMDELNNNIQEYLVFHGYDQTIHEFQKERISNSYTQIKLQHNLMNPNIVNDDAMRHEILQKIVAMFDANDIDGILKLWNRYLSKDILNTSPYAIKLECHLHIYKFVMQLQQSNHHNQNLNDIRSELQSYFNDNGQRLGLCQDVLPYFSLPYIDNAHTHPVFAQFFDSGFGQNIRSQLTGFMLKSLDTITVPKLHSIYAISKRMNKKDLLPNNDSNILKDTKNIDYLTQILRVTSDFIKQMQYCVNHSLPPSPVMVGDCKQKMSKIAASILDSRRIPHQMQVTDATGDVPAVQYDDDGQHALLSTIRSSANIRETPQVAPSKQFSFQTIKSPQHTPQNTNSSKVVPAPNTTIYLNVNYTKIKQALSIQPDATIDDQTKLLLLLQSLRWRITKLIRHNEKRTIVVEYIRNDIFQCHDIKIISNLLKHSNKQIIETSLRLFNVISSFAIGRTYLLKLDNDQLIDILSVILTSTTEDDSIRMNSLGCLQKLSLRRELQDNMIAKGLIGWIIEMLNDELNDLSEYTVEYSTALLMNLTLRTKGKKQCQLNEQHINKILMTLLKLLNSPFVAQIHTYVNGVLYSLLSEKNIHETAVKMDLIGKLNECVTKYDQPAFKQQIDYIISQLSATDNLLDLHDGDDNDEDSDEASNEDYSENEDYEEYDVNELIDYLKEQKEDEYVQGDQFLFSKYQQNEKSATLNIEPLQIKRPVTPQPLPQITVKDKERMPKFSSPTNAEKQQEPESQPGITPRNVKWMEDDDYRKAFGPGHRVPRTPPYGAMVKKGKK